MNLRTPRRITSLAVLSTAAALAFALAGCTSPTSGGDAPAAPAASAESPTTPAAASPAATPDTADSLTPLVLATSELPVGGWTADGGVMGNESSSSGPETSQDATGPGACGLTFDSYFDQSVPGAGQKWSRAATDSTLASVVLGDPDGRRRVEALSGALAACPPKSQFTQNGSLTTVTLSVLDVGELGDARTCYSAEIYANTTYAYLTQCFVAVGSRLVGTTVNAPYASQLPSQDEVAKITAAAVAKVAAG
jgi:hypothetical protein